MGSGLLAWCTRGLPVSLAEVTIYDPKPARRLKMWCDDEEKLVEVDGEAHVHVVVKLALDLSVDDGGIIADATYHQYWFDSGIDDYHRYKVRKTYETTYAVEEDDFGTLHQAFQTQLREAMGEGESNFGLFCGEILSRVTNNMVCSEVEIHGGRDILLDVGADEFLAAHGGILKALRKQLKYLRTYIQRLYFVDGDVDHLLLELLQMCVGEGHKECTKALQERKKHLVLPL